MKKMQIITLLSSKLSKLIITMLIIRLLHRIKLWLILREMLLNHKGKMKKAISTSMINNKEMNKERPLSYKPI